VLNRANSRRKIFEGAGDYLAFERILAEVRLRVPMRILAWCLMPNHWHLVLWPTEDGHLSNYMRLVTLTHTQRWHARRRSAGTGHLYQGRFKSFAVQDSAHFLTVCRYVEANALRAGLVRRAEDWRWGSLSSRCKGSAGRLECTEPWPVPRPRDWLEFVNETPPASEMAALRTSAQRGAPLGDVEWVTGMAARLALECSLRKRGRPARAPAEEKGPDPF
jgi:putative transposase